MGSLIDPMPGNERELLYFPVYLIDLSVRKFDELSGKPAVRALLTALKAAGAKRLDDELETIFGALNDESDDARFLDWLRALVIYVFRQIDSKPERVDRVLDRMKKSKEATTMATSLMERLLLEGEVKGEAKMLIRALERRFGAVAPELRERIGSCPNTERLEAWLDLAMSTSSLAEFTEKMG